MRRTWCVRGRRYISRGGAINSNVFTRFLLSLFGVLTWRSVPVLPVVGLHEHRVFGTDIGNGLFTRFDVQIENRDACALLLHQVDGRSQTEP